MNLSVVVPDNDGGGIFSHLPIAARGDEVGFDALFHAPHGLNLVDVASIGAVRARRVSDLASFDTELRSCLATAGVDVVVVPIDHGNDMARRLEIQAGVALAVDELLSSAV